MIAVIFESAPAEGAGERYLELGAALRHKLQAVDGFISVERYQSLANPSRLLSLSFFRDEEAVRAWRNTPAHRATQALGRGGLFADYRLRVAEVIRDYGLLDRSMAPQDSKIAHPTKP